MKVRGKLIIWGIAVAIAVVSTIISVVLNLRKSKSGPSDFSKASLG
jgi:hypothetical protein